MFLKGSPAIGAGDLLRLLLCGLSFHIHGLSLYSRTILSTFTFENHSAFTFWFQLHQVNTVRDHIQCFQMPNHFILLTLIQMPNHSGLGDTLLF
jgi:hypothetical protein